jgi:hypothetical protein
MQSAWLGQESHRDPDLLFCEKQIICISSPKSSPAFLSFRGRKNELLPECFQHVPRLDNVMICCGVTTLSTDPAEWQTQAIPQLTDDMGPSNSFMVE